MIMQQSVNNWNNEPEIIDEWMVRVLRSARSEIPGPLQSVVIRKMSNTGRVYETNMPMLLS